MNKEKLKFGKREPNKKSIAFKLLNVSSILIDMFLSCYASSSFKMINQPLVFLDYLSMGGAICP